jgi:ABC-type Fe3+-hydroxamate transport system substrate-binding protein
MSRKCLYALSTLLLILLTACGKTEEQPAPTTEPAPGAAPSPAGISAGAISLGKAVGPDKKVSAPVEAFAKGDTIYASVETTGTGTATLKAKWTYKKGDQTTVVSEDPQTITPTGPATTEFHISKPGGWPAGQYQVEVFLDDKPVGVKNFTVN